MPARTRRPGGQLLSVPSYDNFYERTPADCNLQYLKSIGSICLKPLLKDTLRNALSFYWFFNIHVRTIWEKTPLGSVLGIFPPFPSHFFLKQQAGSEDREANHGVNVHALLQRLVSGLQGPCHGFALCWAALHHQPAAVSVLGAGLQPHTRCAGCAGCAPKHGMLTLMWRRRSAWSAPRAPAQCRIAQSLLSHEHLPHLGVVVKMRCVALPSLWLSLNFWVKEKEIKIHPENDDTFHFIVPL